MFRSFIDAARAQTVFCPQRKHNIPVLTCLNMPRKEELLRLFNVGIKDGIHRKKKFVVQHQAGLKELAKILEVPTKVPDCQWLLLLIAAVGGPEHPVFQKGYTPPKPEEIIAPLYK